MRLPHRALIALLPIALTGPCLAQYSIEKLDIRGSAPYTSAEIATVSGLQAGQMLGHDSLVNAAQHLLDTGLFDDAQVSLAGAGRARTVVVELKPTPLAKLLPASFANMIWFSPQELEKGIHQRVPLYRGVASDAGNLPDAIQAALQDMLTAKSIPAKLTHAIGEPTTQHPVRVMSFAVAEPAVRLANLHLSLAAPEGATAALVPLLKPALARAYGHPLNQGLTGFTLEDQLLTPLRSAGYITAKLDVSDCVPAPAPHGLDVTCNASITTGSPYKVAAITWESTPLYSAASFDAANKLHPGDFANATALAESEHSIAEAYLLQGYMDAYIVSNPVLDDAAHTVNYTLHALPGEVYRLQTLTVNGLTDADRKAFDTLWLMKPGDPYSDIAANQFLRKNAAQPPLRNYSAAFRASSDPQTHLVDLTFSFHPNSVR